MGNKCENLPLYIINELNQCEREGFEIHLKTCVHCQTDLKSLHQTWQTLSYDIEEVEVPKSLKTEVMDFIFENSSKQQQSQVSEKQNIIDQLKSYFLKYFSPLSTAIIAVLLVGFIGLCWNNIQMQNKMTAVNSTKANSTFNLKGQGLASSANGEAYLVPKGGYTVLVVDLYQLPSTKDNEVYQVWLIKNGSRQSAGTIKPDSKGNGLITYRIPSKYSSFDDIGITLESTPDNTQPQGPKVLGTT